MEKYYQLAANYCTVNLFPVNVFRRYEKKTLAGNEPTYSSRRSPNSVVLFNETLKSVKEGMGQSIQEWTK